jgi:hypothetical protein
MTDWFYEYSGGQKGPVSKEGLIDLFKSGHISTRTLVWTKEFGVTWKAFSEANPEVIVASDTPPPLPASPPVIQLRNDSIWPWVIALTPLVSIFTDNIIKDNSNGSEEFSLSLLLSFGIYSALILVDVRSINARNLNPEGKALGAFFWLVPLYLYRRASVLKQPKWYFVTWFVALGVTLFLENPDLFNGTTYLGVGTPTCDASSTKNMMKQIFEGTAIAKSLSVKVIDFDSISQVSFDDQVRTCTIGLTISNGNTLKYSLKIAPKNDQFLYTLTPD